MLINLRNALMAGKRLPYDAELEYLESTGTQWIDTGYAPNANSDIHLSVQFTSTAMQQMGVGRQSSSQWALLCGFYNSKVCAWVNAQQFTNVLASSTDRIDIFFNCATGAYGGGSTTFSGLVPPSEQVPTFGLFARNNGNNRSAFCSCRIFSFQVYENGVLVRDFIPVRVGTVGYLYDRVSGALFGNAGTGDFVVGPDKAASSRGGYKRKCVRRSYRRSSRPSVRSWRRNLWKEVA